MSFCGTHLHTISTIQIRLVGWNSDISSVEKFKHGNTKTDDLLLTVTTLFKRKYQYHDTCVLCSETETRDHLLRCNDKSRIKWRRQMLTALRSRFIYQETEFSLAETFCTAVAEWIETETVNVSTYPVKFQKAINTQSHIRWRHIFSGKVSQEWLHLQEQSTKISTETIHSPMRAEERGGTRKDSRKIGTYKKDKAKWISTQTE